MPSKKASSFSSSKEGDRPPASSSPAASRPPPVAREEEEEEKEDVSSVAVVSVSDLLLKNSHRHVSSTTSSSSSHHHPTTTMLPYSEPIEVSHFSKTKSGDTFFDARNLKRVREVRMPFDLNEGFANFRDRDRLNEYPAPLMPLFESLERSGKASLLLGAFCFLSVLCFILVVFVVWCVFASFAFSLAGKAPRRFSYIRASSPFFSTVVSIIAALLTSASSLPFSVYIYIYIYSDVVIFFERRRGRVIVAREHE